LRQLFKIIFGKEEIDYESIARDMERAAEIRSIKERIERLRQSLHSSRPETVERAREISEPKQDMERARKNKELDDIKAKLMGIKK
jgi:DNA-binding protein H-NS